MSEAFKVIEIHTSEDARHGGVPIQRAVLDRVAALGAGARCVVTKGVAGEYEDGSRAAAGVEIGRASCRERCCALCRSRWSPYH